ncbi:MAG: tyrosine-type recombinase/integrase [Anaerolineae bacterium]|nr:tyrosine-type recombinase/integrase [Anaerolineae bacterium]
MRLIDALDIYLHKYKSRTAINYEGILRPLIEFLGTTRDVDRVTALELQQWINQMTSQDKLFEGHPKRPAEDGALSPYTVHGRVKTIRAFFSWLVKMDVLQPSQNPVRNIEQKTLPKKVRNERIATDDEVQLIRMATFGHVRDYAIVLLLCDTGCRAMEIAGMLLDKLYVEELYAEVLGKGSIRRDVFFGEETAAAIGRWLQKRPTSDHNYVFSATRHPYAALTPRAVSDMVERAALRAGIERPIHSHHLRHWRATNLIQHQVDIPTAAAAIGDSIQVFEAHYLHTNRERVQNAVRRTAFQSKKSANPPNIVRMEDAG